MVLQSDAIRARELRKYFIPDESFHHLPGVRGPPSSDQTLQSLVQLAALRSGFSRAIVCMLDDRNQFFLAEGTSAYDRRDSAPGKDDDDLWLGCSVRSKDGTLCDHTLRRALEASSTSEPYFMVPDMREDERFQDLPFVTGDPGWRCYLGVPIITKRQIAIGTLYILDTSPHPVLDSGLVSFLSTLANTLMTHLETVRSASRHRRGLKMSRGLSSFIGSMTKVSHNTGDRFRKGASKSKVRKGPDSPRTGGFQSPAALSTGAVSRNSSDNISIGRNSVGGLSHNSSLESLHSSDSDPDDLSALEPRNKMYFTAAKTLRKCLEADGVVFFDSAVGFVVEQSKGVPELKVEVKAQRVFTSATFDHTNPLQEQSSTKAAIISYSVPGDTAVDAIERQYIRNTGQDFTSIDESALRYLTMSYGAGKLWALDEYGIVSSSEESGPSDGDKANPASLRYDQGLQQMVPSHRPEFESNLFSQIFPDARQLLFYPIFEPVTQRPFAGCFAWLNNISPPFSKGVELSFFKAFLNNVSSEISRLDAAYADEQKTHFISSISHELRSPLHGILGATEFLRETDCDEHQRDLVETVESSGKALLDTINSILDYSKINSFNVNRRTRKTFGLPSQPVNIMQPGNPVNGLAVPVNVAVLCEEISDGALAGFIFSGFSSDITDKDRKTSTDQPRYLNDSSAQSTAAAVQETVTLIIDIEAGDWNFVTEPGAIRRILMNLVGNSLKYTAAAGCIKISLKTAGIQSPAAENPVTSVYLTVSDDGRGISNAFLKQSLFLPFTQETALSTGLGLGMSIVRSIVNSMSGQIEVKSQLGIGTDVTIRLPLKRAERAGSRSSAGSDDHASSVSGSHSLDHLVTEAKATRCKRAFFFGFETAVEGRGSRLDMVLISLRQTLTSWLDIEATGIDSNQYYAKDSQLAIVNEPQIDQYLAWERHHLPEASRLPLVIVYDKTRRPRSDLLSSHEFRRPCALVSKPIGPMKLTKAILHALKGDQDDFVSPIDVNPASPLGTNILDKAVDKKDREVKETAKAVARETGTHVPYFTQVSSTRHEMTPTELSSETSPPSNKPQAKSLMQAMSGSRSALQDSFPSLSPPPSLPVRWPLSYRTDATRSSSSVPDAPAPRILLVDDNQINLKLIDMFMKKKQCQKTKKAENGLQAVEAVQQNSFDIIFMDLSMPVMNGFEATRAIRSLENDPLRDIGSTTAAAHIIALTGLASDIDRSAAFEAGVDQYVTKPVKFAEVGQIIDEWIERQPKGGRENSEA